MAADGRDPCTDVATETCGDQQSKDKSTAESGAKKRRHMERSSSVRVEVGGDTSIRAVNIDLHESDSRDRSVSEYYSLCTASSGLHVTTSCFTIWRKHKRTNGFAKVIPAVPSSRPDGHAERVFFFDDNLEWEGLEKSPGICNLRNLESGEFVEFAEGSNGFQREYAGTHTVIHHSTEYQNVLVKANILDAMEDQEYFSKIIRRFTKADERVIVYMDVNSTIVCSDSVQGKDSSATLLSTMFEFVEIRPNEPSEFKWESFPPVRLEKTSTLKTVVKELTVNDREAYSGFFSVQNCTKFLDEITALGEIRWTSKDEPLSREGFLYSYEQYLVAMSNDISKDGITKSWFRVFEALAKPSSEHTVVLNSFGVDTRKVVLATVPDETQVVQITVNWDLWDERDTQKFKSQFESASKPLKAADVLLNDVKELRPQGVSEPAGPVVVHGGPLPEPWAAPGKSVEAPPPRSPRAAPDVVSL